ncbi:MAG: uracil-DNA glycosylase [Vicinamibacterales bacterium]
MSCTRCPRLRAYCARVAKEKRAAFRDEVYWGRPVPGFGDRRGRILVLGLAPAAHGANRTGRVFTGDRSADFLLNAMHGAGFANVPTSRHAKDGLKLKDAYITAVIRCAPPENKPTPKEIANCSSFLEAELAALTQVRTIVTLGKVAFDAYWRLIARYGVTPRPRPHFAHGFVFQAPGVPALVASYHPSQQNTNTGKLTPPMLASVFAKAKKIASG